MKDLLTILCGDALDRLRELPNESVHCCVTSPPYFGLRDYGVPGQIGLEDSPESYIAKMVEIFREVGRVLRPDGTLWLNLGDCYSGSRKGGNPGNSPHVKQRSNEGSLSVRGFVCDVGKSKDLLMIPARVAIALQADGWYLRSKITWLKRVPMPESVTDRPTSATEEIFILTKSPRYFYDAEAVRQPASETFAKDRRWATGGTDKNEKDGYAEAGAQNPKQLHKMFDRGRGWHGGGKQNPGNGQQHFGDGRGNYGLREDKQRGHSRRHAGFNDRWDHMPKEEQMAFGSNMRNYWLLSPAPYPKAHFATFPPEVPRRCILAGTSARGCCPQCGTPWLRIVSRRRQFESGSGKSGNLPTGKNGSHHQGGGDTVDIRRGPVVGSLTDGWRPTCEHYPRVTEWLEVPDQKKRESDKRYAVRIAPISALRSDLLSLWGGVRTIPCVVLDPFGGSGTTGQVALELGRRAILIELNPKYIPLIQERCAVTPSLQLA